MGLNSGNGADDLIIPQLTIEKTFKYKLPIDKLTSPLMFKGKDGMDYQTPEGLFAADAEWNDRMYAPINKENIQEILPRDDSINIVPRDYSFDTSRMMGDRQMKIPDNVRGPFKDFKLDANGSTVDWQEYYEVNGVRVPAEVHESRQYAEIAKLMGITIEELRDRVASLLLQISNGKDLDLLIHGEPDIKSGE